MEKVMELFFLRPGSTVQSSCVDLVLFCLLVLFILVLLSNFFVFVVPLLRSSVF